MKKLLKRALMVVLLMLALLSTYEYITGIHVSAMVSWAIGGFHVSQEAEPVQSTENDGENLTEVIQTLDNREDWSQYPSVEVVATGYTAGVESTGKSPGHPQYGITFSGVKVKRDVYSTIAADPKVFPLGTILYIPGYGYGVVADTGSKIKGNIIDLYFDTVEDVYSQWGKKTVEVYVIKKGNGNVTEEVMKQLNEDEAVQVFRQTFLKNE